MPDDKPSASNLIERLIQEQRAGIDEHIGDVPPPFTLTHVRQLQRKTNHWVLLIFLVWLIVVSGVGAQIYPLFEKNIVLAFLAVVLTLILTIIPLVYCLIRIQRRFGLLCPYCQATFIHMEDIKSIEIKDPVENKETRRRCSKCQAILIDMNR